MTDDETAYLCLHIERLVRVWTALNIVRAEKRNALSSILADVCSDHLRNMLHELANKKTWTLGFSANGSEKHKRLFQRLLDANQWFQGSNGLHYRNATGSHLQPLAQTEHMFQQFEWKHLTKGVAACVRMMKLIDGGKHGTFWKSERAHIIKGEPPVPNGYNSLIVALKVGMTCESAAGGPT